MSSELLTTGISLILLQLVSRLLTFLLNQALLRFASPEALGTASIQFDVLINTVLFFSREGVRGALSRNQHEFDHSPSKPQSAQRPSSHTTDQRTPTRSISLARRQQIINASFLPIPVGLMFSVLLFLAYRITLDPATSSQPHFQVALLFYLFAVICELGSEPAFMYFILTGQTARRVRVEAIAVMLRTMTTLLVVVLGHYHHHEWGLLGFAIGQSSYGLSLFIGFWSAHWLSQSNQPEHQRIQLFPRYNAPVPQLKSSNTKVLEFWISKPDLSLTYALTRQSIIKQFLTEGDKMIISKISPIAHQGGYALAMNYGSLVARILFQPVEETARLYFTKNLSASSSLRDHKDPNLKGSADIAWEASLDLITNLLQCHIYLALIFITFGPPFVRLGLCILLGPRSAYLSEGDRSTVVDVLRSYCYLLPLLGFNGILEAFVQSAANETDLDSMSKLMAVWCALFIGATALFNTSWVSETLGIRTEVGMVMATGVNMICRIVYGWIFLTRYLGRRSTGPSVSLSRASPPLVVVSLFVLAAAISRWSESRYSQSIQYSSPPILVSKETLTHLTCGVLCLGVCVLATGISERSRIRAILSSISKSKKA